MIGWLDGSGVLERSLGSLLVVEGNQHGGGGVLDTTVALPAELLSHTWYATSRGVFSRLLSYSSVVTSLWL